MPPSTGIRIQFTAITAPRLDQALAVEAIAAEMLARTYAFCSKAVEELKKYPPPAEGVRFARSSKGVETGTELEAEFFEIPRSFNLQRSWQIVPFQPSAAGRGGVGFRIINNANESGRIAGGKRLSSGHRNYAVWVQGPPAHAETTGGHHQAEWHTQQGWPSVTTVLNDLGGRAGLRADLQGIFNRHLHR
jgi:hypothetical protein